MLELNGIRGRISILIEIGCGRLLEEEYLFWRSCIMDSSLGVELRLGCAGGNHEELQEFQNIGLAEQCLSVEALFRCQKSISWCSSRTVKKLGSVVENILSVNWCTGPFRWKVDGFTAVGALWENREAATPLIGKTGKLCPVFIQLDFHQLAKPYCNNLPMCSTLKMMRANGRERIDFVSLLLVNNVLVENKGGFMGKHHHSLNSSKLFFEQQQSPTRGTCGVILSLKFLLCHSPFERLRV